jgi:hypothetical protein
MTMLRTSIEKLAPSGRMRRVLARAGLVPLAGPDLSALHLPEDQAPGEACAVEVPDLGGITLMPAGWPEPPVDATLRRTSGTTGGNVQTLDYVTEASADEVLAAYESALVSYDAVREDHGAGEMVWGTVGDIGFQVTVEPAGFTILFAGQ